MGQIKIKKNEAVEGVSKFSKHAVPSEEEVREEEINESLMEIYQNEDGEIINVSTLDKKKRHGFLYYFLTTVLTLGILGGGGWYGYKYYYLFGNPSAGSVEISIDAPREIVSGEEFSYTVNYKNQSGIGIKNIEIKMTYPENFIFLESSPLAKDKNNIWQLEDLGSHRSGKIEIKGRVVGLKDQVAVAFANMTYVPENFSSEFRKDATFETVVSGIGIDYNLSSENAVLVNESKVISLRFQKEKDGYLNNFRLTVAGSDAFVLATSSGMKDENIEMAKAGVWLVKKIDADPTDLNIGFKFKEKNKPMEEVTLTFEYSEDGEEYYKFLEKKITFEIIKNDLNLNLILNGSRNDQGIDFDQTLNYSIVYSNKGDEEMKDVVIMAVLNSDILDWTKLADDNKGRVSGNTISWSKEEIPALASLVKNSEGTIDFAIKVVPLDKVRVGSADFDPNRKYEAQSYVQFSIGGNQSAGNEETKSNIILSKVNSDLKLDEKVQYFNADNIAVGSGPLPPKVGEVTSYRVFWTITNNLHELNGLKAEVILPAYVKWEDKNKATAGSIQYDEASRKVTWDVGRLPVDVYQVEADFSISITPVESDRDTIMVLLPSASLEAIDNITGAEIKKNTKAKTTSLEDDEIANTDGRVVK